MAFEQQFAFKIVTLVSLHRIFDLMLGIVQLLSDISLALLPAYYVSPGSHRQLHPLLKSFV